MDSDEFDGDDLADEDFMVAATQPTTPPRASSAPNNNYNRRVQAAVRAPAPSVSLGNSTSRRPRPQVSGWMLWCYLECFCFLISYILWYYLAKQLVHGVGLGFL